MLTFREYRKEDKDAVFDLHIRALKSTGAYIDDPSMRGTWDHDLDTIEETYLNGSGTFLIVELDGKMVGMGAFRRFDADTAEVKRMRVDPEHQRKGIGTELLDRLLAKAKERGYTRAVLDVSTLQPAAIHLYESKGFELYKEDVHYGQQMRYYQRSL